MLSTRQRVHRLETEVLPVFAKALLDVMYNIEGIQKNMATKEDFTALTAAVTEIANEISIVAGLLGSGQDNNNQGTIDALTARLTAAAEALKAAIPAPVETTTPAETAAPADNTPPADPADGSTDAPAA